MNKKATPASKKAKKWKVKLFSKSLASEVDFMISTIIYLLMTWF
jgi:hypothetical protein